MGLFPRLKMPIKNLALPPCGEACTWYFLITKVDALLNWEAFDLQLTLRMLVLEVACPWFFFIESTRPIYHILSWIYSDEIIITHSFLKRFEGSKKVVLLVLFSKVYCYPIWCSVLSFRRLLSTFFTVATNVHYFSHYRPLCSRFIHYLNQQYK